MKIYTSLYLTLFLLRIAYGADQMVYGDYTSLQGYTAPNEPMNGMSVS